MAVRLAIHPAFYRRARYYRTWIGEREGRPLVARKFVAAVEKTVLQRIENPGRGHSAGFEAGDLSDILRVAVSGFKTFAVFFRWKGEVLTIVTLEHTAQDLPARLAGVLALD